MFSKTAQYYDRIYFEKDYADEVRRLCALIGKRNSSPGLTLLDVACGTGAHIEHLKKHYRVQGLDLCDELLEIARRRNLELIFHLADMTDFDLGEQFDIVTCLFSSIGYVKTLDRLRMAIHCMVDHLKPDGQLIVEPWFTPDKWRPNSVHADLVDEPELKIARVNTSFVEGNVSIFDLHHLIATPAGTEHVVEHHELGLFETAEMTAVMEEEGLVVEFDPDGLTGRGLFVATR